MEWMHLCQSMQTSHACSKKTGALIHSMKFLSLEVALYLYKSTIWPCMKYIYCCHVWTGAPTCNCLISYKKRYARLQVLSLATSLESFTQHQNEASLSLFLKAVTYPEFFWVDRLLLGIPTSPFCHHGWRKFLNLVLPDALKMHSLAVPVLRFLCKTFSKLRKLNNETLFSMDV